MTNKYTIVVFVSWMHKMNIHYEQQVHVVHSSDYIVFHHALDELLDKVASEALTKAGHQRIEDIVIMYTCLIGDKFFCEGTYNGKPKTSTAKLPDKFADVT